MRIRFKWVAITVAVLLLLVIAVPLIAVIVVDPNAYKGQIVSAVKTHTGRDLEIPGDLSWGLNWNLTLSLELGKLVLGNAPGFGDTPFARIENAAVAVEVMPLLSGETQLGPVVLDGLFLNLQRNAKGGTNWDDLTGQPSAQAAPDKPAEEPTDKSAPAGAIAIGGLDIRNAEIRWQDDMAKTKHTLKDFSLHSGAIAPGETFPLQLGFTFESSEPAVTLTTQFEAKVNADLGRQVYTLTALSSTQNLNGKAVPGGKLEMKLDVAALTADLSQNHYSVKDAHWTTDGVKIQAALDSKGPADNSQLKGKLALTISDGKALAKFAPEMQMDLALLNGTTLTLPIDANLGKQTAAIKPLQLKGPLLNVQSNLNITQALDAPQVKGDLEVAQFNARELMSKLGLPVPVTADKKVLTKVALRANIAAKVSETNTRFSLPNTKLTLDDTTITGLLALDDLNRQALRFDLDVDKLNADRYLPPEDKSKKDAKDKPAGKGTAPAAKAEPLPLEPLRTLDLDGKLRVGALQVSNVKLSRINAVAKARNGKLTLNPFTALLYDGSYAGSAVINAKPKTPTFAVTSKLAKVNLGPLVKDFMGKPHLTGRGQLNFNLTASGNTVPAIKQRLNGTAGFKLANGTVTLINPDELAAFIKAKIKKQPLPPEKKMFSKSGYEQMSGTGKIVNGVLHNKDLLVKSPHANMTGAGKVHLANETIDYKVTVIYGQSKDGKYKEFEGLPISVSINGPFDNLSKRFDFERFIKAWAKRDAQRAIDKEKKKVEDKYKDKYKKKLEDKLKGLF